MRETPVNWFKISEDLQDGITVWWLIGLTYPGTKVTLLSGVDGNLSTSHFSIIHLGQGNNYSHLASMCLINGIINKLMLNYRLQGIVANYNLRRNAIDYHSN